MFRKNINEEIEAVADLKRTIEQIDIAEKEFYLEYEDEVLQLKNSIEEIKKEQITSLTYLEDKLKNKLAYLFETFDDINIKMSGCGDNKIESRNEVGYYKYIVCM